MPIYRHISKKLLLLWFDELTKHAIRLMNYQDENSLCYFILKLYEYLQCKAKIDSAQETELNNIKITIKDIKSKLNSNSCFEVANRLMALRNAIGHGSPEDIVDQILALLSEDIFYDFLKECGLSSDFISLVNSFSFAFINKDALRSSCLLKCEHKLQSIRKTDVRLNSIYQELYSEYPRDIVNECLITVLGEEYVI